MTAIICDDEARVCALIERLVDWDALGLSLCGTACDGYEALRLIREKKPDIVITDIRMPGLDGMGLIRSAQQAGAACKFVIVSGYRHFEYAHSALRHGVEEYLLKPIQQDELNRCLQRLCRQPSASAAGSPAVLHRHFMGNLLFGDCPKSDYEIGKVNSLCGLGFRPGPAAVLTLRADVPGRPAQNPGPALVEEAMDRMAAQCRELFGQSVCLVRTGVVFAVVNGGFENAAELEAQARQLHDALRWWAESAGLKATLGIGQPRETFDGIVASMLEAVDCLKCRLSMGLGGVIAYSGLEGHSTVTLEELLGHDWRIRWAQALEDGEAEGMDACLREFFAQMGEGQAQGADPRLYYELCALIITSALEGHGSTVEYGAERDEQERKIRQQLLECSTVECMRMKLGKWLDQRAARQAGMRREQDRMPIRRAKRYIRDNYMEQITLEDVAGQVHFNPNYLSSLFKNEVGMGFAEYLVQVRVEAAKALLRDGKCSMEQVACQVGYQNAKYFTRLFRKATGITPSKYRSLYS